MLRRSQWTGPVKSSQHWSILPCWSRIWVACSCTRSKQLLIRKYFPTTSLALPSHWLSNTIWQLQGSKSSDMRFLLRLLMLQRDVTSRLARRALSLAFCWPWDAGWVQLLWHVGKCKSLDQSVLTVIVVCMYTICIFHISLCFHHVHLHWIITGGFYLGGAAGAQPCLHRALWGPWTQGLRGFPNWSCYNPRELLGPCSTIGLH